MISSPSRIVPILLALLGSAAAQSPGPDYPNCASVSRGAGGGPWGWELLQFAYNPIMRGRSDAREAKLSLDFVNLADGSRTVCRLSGSGANSAGSVVLNNTSPKTSSACETYWVARSADVSTSGGSGGGTKKKAPVVASVAYDTEASTLTVNQTWTCREGGQVTSFTGTTTERLDIQCYDGSAGRTSCGQASTPESLSYSKIAMVFLLGNNLPAASPSSPPPSSASPISCSTQQPTWQILSMLFTPPGPWPKSTLYWPTSLQLELRSLVDGSRTKCTLGADDATTSSESAEVLLNNNGGERLAAPGDFPNRLRGCETGVFVVPSSSSSSSTSGGAKSTKPQWKGTEVAEASFDTKTRVFALNQTWACGADRIVGHVTQTLKMDCVDTNDRYAPRQCEPKGAVFSASGAPVVLGPGTAGPESDE